jgi:hypothetical protein
VKPISQLVPDAAAFDRQIVAGLRRAVGHTITTAVTKARSEHRWQDRTYATRESIDGGVSDTSKGASGYIKAGKIAAMLNDGTRPHVIRPRLGAHFIGPALEGQTRRSRGRARRFLKFSVGGQTVFARQVNHPGTKADPYLEAAQDFAGEEIDRAVGALLDSLL